MTTLCSSYTTGGLRLLALGIPPGLRREWQLAEKLYTEGKIRNIALFFKSVSGLPDPAQLAKVVEFRASIEREKKHFSKPFSNTNEFCDALEGYLANWLRNYPSGMGSPSSGVHPITPTVLATDGSSTPVPAIPAPPGFEYWIAEAGRLFDGEARNYFAMLFCAEKGIDAARSDIEWAQAKDTMGVAQVLLNRLDDALGTFSEVIERGAFSRNTEMHALVGRGLYNKGLTLNQLGRSDEAIASFDDVIARFGAAPELPLREEVAAALHTKGWTLAELGRSDEAIAAYDDLVARFGVAPELSLRGLVAKALYNKGSKFGQLVDQI